MRLFQRRGSLTCQRAVELVTDYLDGALPAGERRALEDHLKSCPHCAEYLTQLRLTIAATGHVDSDGLPSEMRTALISLYRETTRDSPRDTS